MIGQVLGHYTILEEIGAGGMGRVYRARDERLERDVAIKVVPPGLLSDSEARRRFRKEALALSKLNHPNIATIHDFDTHDGVDFLVMEHISGQTLEQKVAAGALSEKETLRLGLQLAEGLSAAHSHGVLHRDLKPSNFRVTSEGRLKILDFGLARFLPSADGSATTETESHSVGGGTLPYMAPEQLLGERVDERTDIYGLGGVLYEMATGQRPFPERQSSRLTEAILRQTAVPPRVVNPRLSAGLEQVITKCLEKEPDNRFQSANEVAVDLRRLATASASPTPSSTKQHWRRSWIVPAAVGLLVIGLALVWGLIAGRGREDSAGPAPHIDSLAVLPLQNLSGDPGQEYFADGMTEELISSMAKVGELRVISRTSVMQYKGARKPLPQIARELNVDAIVEGSVLRYGDRVRISAQLIQAANDKHLWAETYDRDMHDVLDMQAEVAQAIARQIQIRITPGEKQRLAQARTVDPAVYEAYLRGRFAWSKRTAGDTWAALAHFQHAIAIDPSFAPAYAGAADCYITLWLSLDAMPREEALPQARAAVQKALQLDPMLAEAHTTLGEILLNADWNWTGAQAEFKKAIEFNPGYATAHHWYGLYFGYLGRTREARPELERARDLDPLSSIIQLNVAWIFYVDRDYDKFIEAVKTVAGRDPNFWVVHWDLGSGYVQSGRFPEAIAELEKAVLLSQRDPATVSSLAYAEARYGQKMKARGLLRELQRRAAKEPVAPENIAIIYIGLDERDQAFQWLDKAYQARSKGLLLLKADPWINSLAPDPRYQELLRQVGLPGG